MDEILVESGDSRPDAQPVKYGGGLAALVIGNAMLLPASTQDGKPVSPAAVRFDLALRVEGETLVRVGGWRITNGVILPPARRVGRGYIPTAEVQPKFMAWLQRATKSWRDVFPTVLFPVDPGETDDRGIEVVE